MRQMHNYVDLNYVDNFSTPTNDYDYKEKGGNRIQESSTDDMLKNIQAQREADIKNIIGSKPPFT